MLRATMDGRCHLDAEPRGTCETDREIRSRSAPADRPWCPFLGESVGTLCGPKPRVKSRVGASFLVQDVRRVLPADGLLARGGFEPLVL